jgi:PAS domain S-box-containing protein
LASLPRSADRSTLAVVMIGLAVVAVGAFLVHDLHRAQQQAQRMYAGSVKGLDVIGELQYHTQEARRSMLYALTTSDSNQQVEYADESRAADAQATQLIHEYRRLTRSPEEITACDQLVTDWQAYLGNRDKVIAAILEGSLKEAVGHLHAGLAAFNLVRRDLQRIKSLCDTQAERQLAGVNALFHRSLVQLSLILAVMILATGYTMRAVQRGRLLRAVQMSEARKSAILNNALDCVITIDHEGRVTEFNPAAEKTFGYSRADAIGQAMADLIVPPDQREAHRRGLARYLATGQTTYLDRRLELTAIRKDGTEFPVELAVTRISGDGPPSFTAFLRDLSERKRAEAELRQAHQQLLETSRQAGMAEVATGVLHNVGNVLTSVNVAATLLSERLRKSRLGNLEKVGALLREHADDLGAFFTHDPKGKALPDYLVKLAEHWKAEEANMLEELGLLTKNIAHIKEIVAMQQSYAKVSGLIESLSVAELVEDALNLNAAAFKRHDIRVERDYQPVPPAAVDKHKVLQILVNLMQNAKYAMEEAGRPDKVLRVGITQPDSHRLAITVADNGVGIPPENLTRIFAHGFTTRRDGHGFGLHSGALAAQELGGNLTAHSDGPGQGATFTLVLPLAKEALAA